MVVTLIGTGNLGTNLCSALTGAGHEVVHLRGRDFLATDVRGDVVIICVKDDYIPSVANQLAGSNALVVHTAGSVSLDVLPTRRRGVLYPMQTFSKERIVDFRDIPVFIESDTDLPLLEALARSLSGRVSRLDSVSRCRLHMAAVFACNFANHCYTLAEDILSQCGLPFDIMLPLIDETARKVHSLPPHEAQTGPAVRFDRTVIRRHEALLGEQERQLYRLMSESIHTRQNNHNDV